MLREQQSIQTEYDDLEASYRLNLSELSAARDRIMQLLTHVERAENVMSILQEEREELSDKVRRGEEGREERGGEERGGEEREELSDKVRRGEEGREERGGEEREQLSDKVRRISGREGGREGWVGGREGGR